MKTLPENHLVYSVYAELHMYIYIVMQLIIKSYFMKTLPENPLVHPVYAELLNHMHACMYSQ